MNVLCHLALGHNSPDLTLGQFLGDFTRGPVHALPYPDSVLQGIRAHRTADALSNQHPFTRNAKLHLHPSQRLYGGLVLDVLGDYLLHRHWDNLMSCDKTDFLLQTHLLLRNPPHPLPPNAARFAAILLDNNLLAAYADTRQIHAALSRMSRRLRRPVDLAALLPPLLAHEHLLLQSFPDFFQDIRLAVST